ncbi:MAG: hypothetical protein P4L84_30715 [Isosphaeraceae bacterium]|nr:hypothetical protein [Isosphaeraceae bacterium]
MRNAFGGAIAAASYDEGAGGERPSQPYRARPGYKLLFDALT